MKRKATAVSTNEQDALRIKKKSVNISELTMEPKSIYANSTVNIYQGIFYSLFLELRLGFGLGLELVLE